MKTLDLAKPRRTRQADDVFPFLVPFHYLQGKTIKLLGRTSMLENLPHKGNVPY